jgi:hypothetical protein
LHQAVCDWLLHGGVPHGCVIESVDDPALSELLRKGETIANAAERYRHRLRELSADLHRVRSSPWPSSLAKEKAKAQIEMLAEAAAPDVDRAIEHNLPVSFGTMTLRSMVRNVDAVGAVAHAETVDAFGTLCWLFRDQMLAKINAAIDEAADDKVALSQQQREEMEAQINSDMLAAERCECSLIWAAAQRGEVVDFRPDTTPMAALGVSLRTAPRVETPEPSSGTQLAMVAMTIVLPGRLACQDDHPAALARDWSVCRQPFRATFNTNRAALGLAPSLLASGPIDQEIIQPSASLNLRPKPSGLLPTAGPNLHWVLRISILRRNGRVRAARPIKARYVVGPLKLT